MTSVPAASTFTPAPLRNRVRVALDAAPPDVWALIGDLARFPEYSSGLEQVEAKVDRSGRPSEYLCTFKPLEPGGERIVSRELIRWWEPNRGYASSGAGGDAFGLANDLHLVAIEPAAAGAVVTWDEHYDVQDLEAMTAHFDDALVDAAENLVRRFGGAIVERYRQT